MLNKITLAVTSILFLVPSYSKEVKEPTKDIKALLAEKADAEERTGFRLIATDKTAGKHHLDKADELRKLNGTKKRSLGKVRRVP